MQTDSVFAYQVEHNDHIVLDGEVVGYVYVVEDSEDSDELLFDVVDDEGEHTQMTFGPFQPVTIVASFLDEDATDGEDIFIDV